jgi:uncharacterized ferritin-like protein (DUF455 family)
MFDFCRRILENGDLATKLEEPGEAEFRSAAVGKGVPAPSLRPMRDPSIAMRGGVEKLPRPGELGDPQARALCLARFAHHELMAVEMFAWAILRWPDAPLHLRRGFLGILRDEQRHCRLYLERLAAHDARLEDHVLSDYFWKHAGAISSSPAGLASFLASMGLTFEQANLDFSPVYRDAFRAAGDEQSARACEVVHRDETAHVRFAADAIRELARAAGEHGLDDIELYGRAVPFPLSAARAKGRRFDAGARTAAGLSDAFIEYIRTARSPQESRARPGRAPDRNS